MMRLPPVTTKPDYVSFGGGIDLKTPVLKLPPGALIVGVNYESNNEGGYQRIDGYERYSGQPSPSDATYGYCTMTITGTAAVGDRVWGATSGAVGFIAWISGSTVALTKMTGTFVSGETIKRGTLGSLPLLLAMNSTVATVGTLTSAVVSTGAPTGLLDAQLLAAAANVYRGDIPKPPGSGPTRGIGILRGITYAWRDNPAGSALQMWRATDGGWVPVVLGYEMSFTAGHIGASNTELADGATVHGRLSGATAIVQRVALQTGTFDGSNAAGRLIFAFNGITGNFQAGEILEINTNGVATVTADATRITLSPGGRVECFQWNFAGSTDTLALYGSDNVNRGFEYDGTVYVPIVTGMADDRPKFCFPHKAKLFFTFRASVQHSGDGLPYQWTTIVGAEELAMGDDVTGFSRQTGDALLIFERNSASQLIGSSRDDFVLKDLTFKEGAVPYTVQSLGDTFYFDDQGARQVRSSADYGNFNTDTLTRKVQSIVKALRPKVIASSSYRNRPSQYRIYGNDGSGVIISTAKLPTQFGGLVQSVIGITTFQYPVNVTCAYAGEDETGDDVVFLGDDQGNVYQADKGSSFDGQNIEAYLITVFNNLKTPRQRKHYRKVIQEMTAVGYASIRVQPIFSYGDPDAAAHALLNSSAQGAGSFWGVGNWGQFYWDARLVATPDFDVNGNGINVALVYYSNNDYDLGHTLQSIFIHYTPRRLARGSTT